MNRKRATIIILVLMALTFTAGCVGEQTSINSREEASEAVTDISTNVEEVSSILEDIDQSFEGGSG